MKLSFDPMTIEHHGFKMYSHLPNAVAELVANSYDADATRVAVTAINSANPHIIVEDDGHGMSALDLEEKYLRIGRNRRPKDSVALSESGRRRVAGRKGLGKLALFGIGEHITVESVREGESSSTIVRLDWNDMLSSEGDYEPETGSGPVKLREHGTRVTISKLKRKTDIEALPLARSLSRLFN